MTRMSRADGELLSYGAVHRRLRKSRGSARNFRCVDCGGPAAQWSYDGNDPEELYGPSGRNISPYSTDPDRYQPRCSACHGRYDAAMSATKPPPDLSTDRPPARNGRPRKAEPIARPTTLDEIDDLAVIEVFSTDGPNYAGLVGIPRSSAYHAVKNGDVPALKLGRYWRIPVGHLLQQLDRLDSSAGSAAS